MTPEDRDRHIRAIIEREGGWVDDPDDSGGPTNYGITLEMWQEYTVHPAIRTPIDMVGRLMAISDDDAVEFYRWYFETQGLDKLIDEFSVPDELVPLVMDMRTLHSMDGCRKILGAALQAAFQVDCVNWMAEADVQDAEVFITLSRMRYMLEVAERRPKDRKYVRGWMHRALKAIGWWPPQDLPEVKEV